VFNKEYLNAPGTAGAKKAQAESKVINDDIASIIFVRAYNTIKSKVDAATEILQSAKKVVSRRISEFELSKVSVDRNKAVF
jgi:alpha-D-ribose 1-methylphosphonate 5-triphosphate synthase subunit PhnI